MKDGPYSPRRREIDRAWTAWILTIFLAMGALAAAQYYLGELKANLEQAAQERAQKVAQ